MIVYIFSLPPEETHGNNHMKPLSAAYRSAWNPERPIELRLSNGRSILPPGFVNSWQNITTTGPPIVRFLIMWIKLWNKSEFTNDPLLRNNRTSKAQYNGCIFLNFSRQENFFKISSSNNL